MRILLSALLCLLLCGCAGEQPPADTEPLPTQSASYIQAKETLEERYGSAVTAHPLTQREVRSLRRTDDGLILVSGQGRTVLTLLREDFSVAAETEPDDALEGSGLCFFDGETRELVILDSGLQPLHRITLPSELTGSPLISPDRNTVYYCTSHAIHAWDLTSGIRRRVKELSYDSQSLTALHLDGQVLQCRVQDGSAVRNLFLDTQTGRLLWEHPGEIDLITQSDRWYASFPAGFRTELVFGSGDAARGLYPRESDSETTFLPGENAAVTVTYLDSGILLEHYDLSAGQRTAVLTLEELHTPKAITEANGCVQILIYDPASDCDAILSWDPSVSELRDTASYTEDYYTAEAPDAAGLALCRAYAEELSARFGVEIRIGPEAAAHQPWDYTFQAEHQYRVIREQLLKLEQCLSRYPPEVLTQTAAHFQGLTVCLVRSIRGSTEDSSLDIATGIQFLEDGRAYVVLSAGAYQEQALYHELFHVMETHILSGAGALDQWDSLNPAGFSYDLDYAANALRSSGVYLQKGQRAFVDTYSMSFPREDRARVFEYAMLSGQESLFREKILQEKLSALCLGIRDAYGLKKWEEALPWEQYLQ